MPDQTQSMAGWMDDGWMDAFIDCLLAVLVTMMMLMMRCCRQNNPFPPAKTQGEWAPVRCKHRIKKSRVK